MRVTIRLNGETRELEARVTLADLPELNRAGDGVAVALNGHVVPRPRWPEKEVQDGDDIEIVHAVQGG